MELHLEKRTYPVLRAGACHSAEETFRADCVVPDALPDVSAILLTEGDFCLWSLDVLESGAELEGEIAVRLCCAGEGGGMPVSVPVQIPVRLHFSGEDLQPGLRPVLRCDLTELQGSLIHARKLRVQCRLRGELTGYQSDEISVTSALGNGEPGLYLRRTPVSVPVISAVEEQVFTAADTVSLRMGFPADARLLSHHSAAVLDEAQTEEGQILLRGRVVSSLLYRDVQREQLVSEEVETAFSQLIDLPGVMPGSEVEAVLHLTSAEITCRNDEQAVDTAFRLVAQMVCASVVDTECVSDAYCTRAPLSAEWADCSCEGLAGVEQRRDYAEGEIACDLAGKTVVAARALSLRDRAAITVLLSGEDGVFSSVSTALPLKDGALLSEPPAAMPGPDGLAIRLPVTVTERSGEERSFRQIVSAELSDDAAEKTAASVTLVRREGAPDLWTLAKTCLSSEDAIRAANPETDPPQKWLLIPRV
jgi:hypothetical protein